MSSLMPTQAICTHGADDNQPQLSVHQMERCIKCGSSLGPEIVHNARAYLLIAKSLYFNI